jgi:hypothetical protein
MKVKLLVALVAVGLLFSAAAYGQTVKITGTLRGVVKDATGAVLPGATVTINSPALITPDLTAVTESTGTYRFPSLPPGVYDVKAELEGFQTIISKGVELHAGITTTFNFTLKVAAVAETITVTAESPLVDIKQSSATVTFGATLLENLPRPTFALDVENYAPGVQGTNAFGGAGDAASSYQLDGVDVSDTEGGTRWVFPNYDWFEEVQFAGVGLNAEYGMFTGQVFNIVTKSGGNEFHGNLTGYFEGDEYLPESLSWSNWEDPDLEPPTVRKRYELSATLGGPILKNKFWFFGSVEKYYHATSILSAEEAAREQWSPRYFIKGTYQLNRNNKISGFYERDVYDVSGRAVTKYVPMECGVYEDSPSNAWNATWTSIISQDTLLDVRYGAFKGYYYLTPNGEGFGHYDLATGYYSVNAIYYYYADRFRQQVNASLTHFADSFLMKGDNHDFKFGVEFERSWMKDQEGYPGDKFYFDYYGAPYLMYTGNSYVIEPRVIRWSFFAQDAWTIKERLTLNLGFRFDYNKAGYPGEGRDNLYVTNCPGFRAGFAYDLFGDGKGAVKGGFFRYYAPIFNDYIYDLSTGYTDLYGYWWNGTDWEQFVHVPFTSVYSIDPNITHPYVDEINFSFERQVLPDLSLRVTYVHRYEHDIISDVEITGIYEPMDYDDPGEDGVAGTADDRTITVYNCLNSADRSWQIMNAPEAYRKYDGLIIVANKRLSNNWLMMGSLTFARAKGNITTARAGGSEWDDRNYDPRYNTYYDGDTGLTREVMLKVNATYFAPWGINLSAYFDMRTGAFWTRYLRVYGLNQGVRTVCAEPRGSRNLETGYSLDLRVEKQINIGRGRLHVAADIFNVFNADTITERYNITGPYFNDIDNLVYPRTLRLGIRYLF